MSIVKELHHEAVLIDIVHRTLAVSLDFGVFVQMLATILGSEFATAFSCVALYHSSVF